MRRWLRNRWQRQAYRDAMLAEIADYLHDISETLERSEATQFDLRNAVDNLAARAGVANA